MRRMQTSTRNVPGNFYKFSSRNHFVSFWETRILEKWKCKKKEEKANVPTLSSSHHIRSFWLSTTQSYTESMLCFGLESIWRQLWCVISIDYQSWQIDRSG
jgi:hypothetical protein